MIGRGKINSKKRIKAIRNANLKQEFYFTKISIFFYCGHLLSLAPSPSAEDEYAKMVTEAPSTQGSFHILVKTNCGWFNTNIFMTLGAYIAAAQNTDDPYAKVVTEQPTAQGVIVAQ